MPPTPPPGAGAPPPGGAAGDAPPPVETFTQYDRERDVYHCSYGPVQAARTVWDPEREIQVRLDQTSQLVIGFSIPNFASWYERNVGEDGDFEIDLPSVWPASPADPEG
jgi:hypothetical protein